MAALFAFKCSCCGNVHEGSPSFAFKAPDQYASLTEEQKLTLGRLTDDLCTIEHAEGTDYFIRAILEVPIHGIEEPFLWGVWVSASEKSFERYVKTYDKPIDGDGFFGWLCNSISVYPKNQTRSADVFVQLDGTRPKVILHCSEESADQLVLDQRDGISFARAQDLAEKAMHG